MYEIGRFNTLKIHHLDEEGAWLQAGRYHILLPAAEVTPPMKKGDRLEVFLYRGTSGDVVATLKRPKAQVGEFALLQVSAVTRHGAFLDWGLDKELLVPFSEQPERLRAGRRYLVKICLDSLGRTVATARIDRCLETEKISLQEGQEVALTLWEFTDLGAKVIINDLYGGLLYQDELPPGRRRGDRLRGYVKRIREDGKIDVTLKKTGAEGVEEAKSAIFAALQPDGFLPLHDQSPPADIRAALGMSKKTFKKAIGGLYKAGKVELTDAGVRLKKPAGAEAKREKAEPPRNSDKKKARRSGDKGNAPKDGGF
jgi:predicted RNA-binding protein (virulence factor B family)